MCPRRIFVSPRMFQDSKYPNAVETGRVCRIRQVEGVVLDIVNVIDLVRAGISCWGILIDQISQDKITTGNVIRC